MKVILMTDKQWRALLKREWLKRHSMRGGAPDFPSPTTLAGAMLLNTPPLALPQTTTKNLFSISTIRPNAAPGVVSIANLFGIITTDIGAVANATKLQFVGTDNAGAALTAVDLCATLDINALTAGYHLHITGTVTDAMTDNAFGVVGGGMATINCGFGTTAVIRVNCAGSDGGTGRVAWFLQAFTSYGVQITPMVS